MRGVLDLNGISKTYKNGQKTVRALSPTDISVKENEFVCIIGPNGCGKSTLLKIIAGILEPSSGTLETEKTAYLPQQTSLLPWRTVLENLLLPVDLQKSPKKPAETRAKKLLKEFGLEKYADSYPDTLSGGMQQKAALLRTAMISPKLILLDEPFSALDAITRTQMQNWLLKLWQKDRPAVICVTHDIREAITLADTIYVLAGQPGKLREKISVGLPRTARADQLHSAQGKKLEKRLGALLELGK